MASVVGWEEIGNLFSDVSLIIVVWFVRKCYLFFFIIPEKPLRINNRNKYVFMCYYYYRNALALVVVVPTLHQESEPWPTAKGPLG